MLLFPISHVIVNISWLLIFSLRAVAQKVDLLITGGGGGVDRMRSGEAVSSSLAVELSHIKTTESNILHQLADLR